MKTTVDEAAANPVRLLQELIRFDTTNPPGNESECIRFIAEVLRAAGLEPVMLGKSPDRQNLVVRLSGRGAAAPLLMYGHADVVTTENQQWQMPPFAGVADDRFVWGRGALDMKGPLAMMLSALLRLKREAAPPPGDIVLAVVCDEEKEGEFGAGYLTRTHANLFENMSHAISELGGFTLHLAGKRFYPIMISEKQRCSFEVILSGAGGHGSMPVRGGVTAKLAALLHKLDTRRLPVHITPPAKMTLEALTRHMPFPAKAALSLLLRPCLTDTVLDWMGEKGKFFDPLLHNTLCATVIRGGHMHNVIPEEVQVTLDGRLLPGLDPELMVREVKSFIGADADIRMGHFMSGPASLDMGLFERLAGIIQAQDPEAIPIPFLNTGVTDARHFSRLGIQTYGFTPMRLPGDMDFSALVHGANERIPLEALAFGAECIYRLISGN